MIWSAIKQCFIKFGSPSDIVISMENDSEQLPILILGAGPTGLVLALALTKLGIKVRIIDKELEPRTASRAIIVHARTLEFYQQLGIAQKVIDNGLRFSAANIWVHGKKKAHISLGDIGAGLSPFPFITIYPQDEHEVMLIAELDSLGVRIERGIEFVSMEQNESLVHTTLKHQDSTIEKCESQYFAACDGAHSTVRKFFSIDFQGTTYQQYFYVADVHAEGSISDQELHVSVDEADFVAIFPLKDKSHARLTGVLKSENFEKDHQFCWDDVKMKALSQLDLKVKSIKWFSSYHVNHRLAERFRNNRAFLLGDAAHIHSPLAGQGMNTGVGDAINLAWKLAAVIKKEMNEKILNSYETERMAYAKTLVSTTDKVFTVMSNPGPVAKFIRLHILPKFMQIISPYNFARYFAFRRLSQIAINYRFSFLSLGRSGKITGGDRMPWVENLGWPHPMNWNARLFGNESLDLQKYFQQNKIEFKIFPWRASLEKYGISKNVLYLIRPDGYIGLIEPNLNLENVRNYLTKYLY